jgi:protein phosphatase
MSVVPLEVAARTHIGRVRRRNEDAFLTLPVQGVIAVADGMGGHSAGELASRVAVDAATGVLMDAQRLDRADDLENLAAVRKALQFANREVIRASEEEAGRKGMGTTLVVAMFRDERIFYAHAGDSRLYRMRGGRLRQLTRDHSLIRQLVDQRVFASLEEARAAGVGDNVLVRSLGMEARVEPDVGDEPLRQGDLFLFCTDGLAGKVPDSAIETILAEDRASLDGAAEALIEAALQAGGPDNVTVVLARSGSAF